MSEPRVPQKSPYLLDMQAGTYWWCACGRSTTQPFCSGAHKGTEFTPVEVKLDAPKKIAWCGCKHSANRPYCDGSHTKL
ncbi:MAG: CDGSH iron-sulfur domain-containing protein [Pseudomonadota bacterium]